ncbi:NAD(P)-dependent dehydrogenase (short-subunit alcohol dehydrogenase family) [Rhizobium sp. BK313]|uniref:SDR family NAD(P)-dependent oxidoreductase n=1 Tax=Rhizobium sp. BK313 TaxID=2587081 RepID=UPI00105FEA76|nr:SDR family oxidoreductase [Rhizobium sp. BK313]MBB3454962.1 NAD(P)-dependent dehydrogenase (short-subunit alcohol dehydrogenase family) [Rhizobium sp. BK313]
MADTKLCILTGAAGEVGRATARRFAESGWSMILCDRTTEVAILAKELSAEFGRTCLGIQMDLANDQEVDQVAKTASDTGIPLRFLGLVAAINHPAVSIENMDMAIWDRVHNVNLRANVKFISACVPLLRKAGKASIVTVASFWGREGHAYFSPYCASKAALISLTQSVAAELAPDIRVNCVAPGNINTPMHFNALAVEAEKRGISADEMREIEWGKIPMGRPAETAEIASAIHFLSTDDASYFIGATLDVNGGCRFT